VTEASLLDLATRVLFPGGQAPASVAAVAGALGARGEALTRALAPVLGNAAVTALFSRALTLTSQQHGWLPDARADDARALLQRVSERLAHRGQREASGAATKFVATVVRLLCTFVGERVALQHLAAAWPDVEWPASGGEVRSEG
jgi:hypothetical protein